MHSHNRLVYSRFGFGNVSEKRGTTDFVNDVRPHIVSPSGTIAAVEEPVVRNKCTSHLHLIAGQEATSSDAQHPIKQEAERTQHDHAHEHPLGAAVIA
jgi:hypothetical protein